MKKATSFLSILLLLLAGCFSQTRAPSPPEPPQAPELALDGGLRLYTPRLSGPYTCENLSVFLIHGKPRAATAEMLTLQQAMAGGQVVVKEADNVNQLVVENRSDRTVFIQSGDIVKGGKQDRVLTLDLVLTPHSGPVALAVFCVEQGRWGGRGGSQQALRTFKASLDQTTSKAMKLATRRAYRKNYKVDVAQSTVWTDVENAQSALSLQLQASSKSVRSPTSLQLTLEHPKLQAAIKALRDKLGGILEGRPDAIGFAFAINGEPNSAELYASGALFRALWPKLLKAAAVEAVMRRTDKPYGPVKSAEIQACIAAAARGKRSSKRISGKLHSLIYRAKTHLLVETRDPRATDAWIHRSYIFHTDKK